jgi:hypothetical protein
MATTGAVIARIISQYSDKGSKAAQKDIAKLGKNIDAFGKKATKAFGLASAAALGLAVKLGKDAVQAAMEDQKQQAALAVALRNTTGATQDAIAANSAFLDSLELQVAIDNNELMPALQRLATATGNLSAAQDLLKLSTDLAAASGKDLGTVSAALSKAVAGNYGPLNKLGLRLDQNAIKGKDFQAVLEQLRDISKGQAAAAANTFAGRMTTLRLRFNQVVESLGYALIPVLEKFVKRIDEEVIPAIERWVNANQKDIIKSMETLISLTEGFMKAIINIGQVMKDYEPILKIFGSGLLAIISYLKITGALIAFRTQLALVLGVLKGASKDFKNFAATGIMAKDEMSGLTKVLYKLRGLDKFVSGLFGIKAGKGLMAAARGLGWIGVGITVAYGAYKGLDWLLDKSAKADVKRKAAQQAAMKKYTDATVQGYDQISLAVTRTKNAEENRQRILDGFKEIEKATAAANKAANDAAKDAAYWAQKDAEQAAEEAKRLRIKQMEASIAKKIAVFNRNLLTDQKKQQAQLAAIKKKNAEIDKKYGIKLTDPDEMNAIQMEAIYQNLVKGGKYLLAERTKQQQILDDLQRKAAEEYNKLLERQQDILKALSGDNKVTIQEVGLLAKQWGLSAEAAQFYVDSVLGIQDAKVDSTQIQFLRSAWGMTQKQAEQYLDFTTAIEAGHGKIGEERIKELAKKWYGSDGESATEAARKYEQAVVALKDQEISAEEITLLAGAWRESEDAVAAYLLQTGIPFTITENAKLLLSPEMIAAIAANWDKARRALEAYLALAKGGIPGGVPGGVPGGSFVPGSGNDPAVIAAANAAAAAAAAAASEAADALAESEKALAESIAALEAATTLGSIRSATTTEEINNAVNLATLLGESASDIANAMMTGLLNQGIDTTSAASSARYTGMAIAEMQRQQAEIAEAAAAYDRALSSGMVRARDIELFGMGATSRGEYVEGFRAAFQSPTTTAGSNFGGGNLLAGGGMNVTVNVAGSVTTEDDLVQSIRQGLLYGQGNGDSITLQAI